MARVRASILRSFLAGVNHTSNMQTLQSYTSGVDFSNYTFQFYPRSSCSNIFNNHSMKGWYYFGNTGYTHKRLLCPHSFVDTRPCKTDFIMTSSPGCLKKSILAETILHCRSSLYPVSINTKSPYRTYSSDKRDIPSASNSGESTIDNTDVLGGDWVDSLKLAWQSAVDAAVYTGIKAKEASDELIPYFQQMLDSHPYLKDVIIPVGGTVSATLLAWLVMPRILRRFHKYSIQAPSVLLSGKLPEEQVSYERSFWGALEDPVRYLITFMAFSQLGVMIAPNTISQYIAQAWRGAIILSFVWFLYRWKTNVLTHAMATQNIAGLDRERLQALDKLSSIGLFILGLMASAEACGVAVQSILTVGGIGGVATAFAARDILGNVLSGLSMQFSRPFSMGDTIKAGSIEGQVVEMGLTTTSLLNSERFPVIVPNSLFSSQVIVNKSRAQWRSMVTKIPVRIDDLEKIPQVSEDIKSMLRSHENVFLGKEAPYCFLSQIEDSCAELIVGCNLKRMSRDELFTTEQDILVKSAQIIKKNGAELGSRSQDRFNT